MLPIFFHFFSISFSHSSSDITLLYNDRSVLENFHISEAFKVMRKDESNIIQNLSRDEYRYGHFCFGWQIKNNIYFYDFTVNFGHL